MNIKYHSAYFINGYDVIVAEAGDNGETTAGAIDALVDRTLAAIDAGELADIKVSRRERVRREIVPVITANRKKRKAQMVEDFEYMADALGNPDESIMLTALYQNAYPLGVTDGRDKALGFWTRMDFEHAVSVRYKNASESLAMAKRVDAAVQRIVQVMERDGVVTLTEKVA